VLLVGGTGLYIRAFLEGLLPGGAADPELRAELEAEQARAAAAGDPERLYRRLCELDP
jgi:tRNA A37 N6-isopentenylltransferase MiaA